MLFNFVYGIKHCKTGTTVRNTKIAFQQIEVITIAGFFGQRV